MIAVPRIPPVSDGQKLDFGLINHIIKRTEYASELLRKYRCVAGDDMFVEPHPDGTRVSYLQAVGGGIKIEQLGGNMYIGIAGSTGGGVSILEVSNFVVNNSIAILDSPLGTATDLGGGSYRLTNNLNDQVGAIWKSIGINSSSFSASFSYSIGGSSQADGITLIFSSAKFLAGTGGGNGYQGGPSTSVAIEIDIFRNNPFDPNNSHIAILKSGDVTNHLDLASPTVRPSGQLSCSYSGGILNVFHNGNAILSYSINIPSITGV